MLRSLSLFTALCVANTGFAGVDIVNGQIVPKSKFREVTIASVDGSKCTATLVGPRAVLMAAHCGSDGKKATFEFKGKAYTGIIHRSPLYPNQDHDLAVAILTKNVKGVEPATIGGAMTIGSSISMYGFGCTTVGGGGGNDGALRMGNSMVIEHSKYDAITRVPAGAALCFGDSGGPATLNTEEKMLVVGIASKGNISDTSYFARLDLEESQTFLKSVAEENGITICGINSDC